MALFGALFYFDAFSENRNYCDLSSQLLQIIKAFNPLHVRKLL